MRVTMLGIGVACLFLCSCASVSMRCRVESGQSRIAEGILAPGGAEWTGTEADEDVVVEYAYDDAALGDGVAKATYKVTFLIRQGMDPDKAASAMVAAFRGANGPCTAFTIDNVVQFRCNGEMVTPTVRVRNVPKGSGNPRPLPPPAQPPISVGGLGLGQE